MEKVIEKIESEHLGKETEIAVYGHFGIAILLFPTLSDSFLENEENGLIKSVENFLDNGKCRIYSVGGIFEDSWLNDKLTNEQKSENHLKYNNYIADEVVQFIFKDCGGAVPIVTCGASKGAFHATNTYFRRPDIFIGTIAMSGTYNLEKYSGGIYDDNCYFNSPVHYLPNLNDSYWLSFLLSRHHVYIVSGEGKGEDPQATRALKDILDQKGIPNHTDTWSPKYGHDWDTWKEMLNHFVGQRL